MSNEEMTNVEEPVGGEETALEVEESVGSEEIALEPEPEAGQQDRRPLWITGGLAVAALVLCTCCLLMAAVFFIGRETGDDVQPTAVAPTKQPESPVSKPPVPVIDAPTEAWVGEEVVFDGSGSQPGSSPIAGYEWDLGDGGFGKGAVVTHVYHAPGKYRVTLTVTGEDGAADASQPVEITIQEAAAPLPTIDSFSVSPTQIPEGECAGISWSVSGAALVQVRRNGKVVIDKGGPAGQQMDCLDQAGSYVYRLEVYNAEGESVFQEATVSVAEAQPENPLAGTRWQVMAIYDAEVGGIGVVLPGTSLTVAFGADGVPSEDGVVKGSAGCNTYSARYLVDGSLLVITPPTATSRICDEPQGIMEQEAAFLSALESAGGFTLEGNQLQIMNASGKPLLDLEPLIR